MTLSDLDAPPAQRTCCPACGTPHADAFDDRACPACAARARDSRGRLIRFEPVGTGDAFEARYRLPTDTERPEIAADVTAFRTCFIDSQPFHVQRNNGGEIHLLPLSSVLSGARR